jgi:hypothetical protein
VPLQVRRHDIRVRGRQQPVSFEVRSTRHGPVRNPDDWHDPLPGDPSTPAVLGGTVLAMQWQPILEQDGAGAFDQLNRAANWTQFVNAVRAFSAPAQNFAGPNAFVAQFYTPIAGNPAATTGATAGLQIVVGGDSGSGVWESLDGGNNFTQVPTTTSVPLATTTLALVYGGFLDNVAQPNVLLWGDSNGRLYFRDQGSGTAIEVVSYTAYRVINYTNFCDVDCTFCSFKDEIESDRGYTLSAEQVAAKTEEALALGVDQIFFQGGVNPKLPLEYYTDTLRMLRDRYGVALRAFSPSS